MSATVEYVYCVVPGTFEVDRQIDGIGGAPVRLVRRGDFATLVSTLDGEQYRPDLIEEQVADMEWLTPLATAHDRIVTWASDRVPTVPMPMWAMFSDEAAIAGVLDTYADRLRSALDKLRDAREYGVRVYCKADIVSAHMSALSPRFAEIERAVAEATPGQAYLLRRKLEGERKEELKAVCREIADATFSALAAQSVDAVTDPLPKKEGEGNAILNAAFLVSSSKYDAFRLTLTDLITQYQPVGFRFDFTGPWPAYHFVRVG